RYRDELEIDLLIGQQAEKAVPRIFQGHRALGRKVSLQIEHSLLIQGRPEACSGLAAEGQDGGEIWPDVRQALTSRFLLDPSEDLPELVRRAGQTGDLTPQRMSG